MNEPPDRKQRLQEWQELADQEADRFASEHNLDPVLFKLFLRVRGSILAHSVIGVKNDSKQ